MTVDENDRLVIWHFLLFMKVYRIVFIYVRNKCSEQECFVLQLPPFLDTEPRAILLGDFNCVFGVRASLSKQAEKASMIISAKGRSFWRS